MNKFDSEAYNKSYDLPFAKVAEFKYIYIQMFLEVFRLKIMSIESKDSNIDPNTDDEPIIILSPLSHPMNLRSKVLQHALMRIGEPTDQSGIITTTL